MELLGLTSEMANCVIRLYCYNNIGNKDDVSIATGSFVGTRHQLMVVTNKHVIDGYQYVRMVLNVKCPSDSTEIEQLPIIIKTDSIIWCQHPDEDIDLCSFNFSYIKSLLEGMGCEVLFKSFLVDQIIDDERAAVVDYVEDILVCGYPNGIWDEVNNKPIFRKGITATNINLDYEGYSEFLIDSAIYPGSSGSPVILYNPFFHITGKEVKFEGRLHLIGIITCNFNHFSNGIIKKVNVSTKVEIAIPNQLGVAVKAKNILKLFDVFDYKEIAGSYTSTEEGLFFEYINL